MAKAPTKSDAASDDGEGTLNSFATEPDAPRTDNYAKAPNTPVPGDMPSHDPSKAPRETNLDPLGVGLPTTAVADPVDTRAIGKQSAIGVTVVNHGPDEDRPTQSPSFAGQFVTTAGITSEDDAASLGQSVAPIKGAPVRYLDGARVQLLKPHYLNNIMFDAGTIIESYTGPTSKDMVEVDDQNQPIKRARA